MANQEQLDILKQGVNVWNKWRNQHPEVLPLLSGGTLSGADLSGADLSRVNLDAADLIGANLSRADLHGANLEEALQLHFQPEQQ